MVCIEYLLGVPDERRCGRLVQVRRGVGGFNSDIYLVRLADGTLSTFENCLMRHANDSAFEAAFYTSNGMLPPKVVNQPILAEDNDKTTYTIKGQWPEVGFLILAPNQPSSHNNKS